MSFNLQLSVILEAGMSRRDFLRQTGGGVVGMLTGAGIPLEKAKQLVGPDAPKLFLDIKIGNDYYDTSADELDEFINAYNFIRQLLGSNQELQSGVSGSEEYMMRSEISPVDLAKVLNRDDLKIDQGFPDEPGIWVEIAPKDKRGFWIDITSTDSSEWSEENLKSMIDPMKSWWNDWGVWGGKSIDDATIAKMAKYDVDATNLPDKAKETLIDQWDESYGDPRKYGMSPEEFRRRMGQRRASVTSYPVPRDYDLASPMHQPFESRLNRALLRV